MTAFCACWIGCCEMNDKINIRIAKISDADHLLEIYAPYVEETAITFEYVVPTREEFEQRMRGILAKYPYIVAESAGTIIGYAYASAFHPRKAYEWCVETTIYIDRGYHGKGIGRQLYEALEAALRLMGVKNANACIATPIKADETLTDASVQFHGKMGYRFVGEFKECGYKFGKWYNMCWMEKHLGEHGKDIKDIAAFPDVRAAFEEMPG